VSRPPPMSPAALTTPIPAADAEPRRWTSLTGLRASPVVLLSAIVALSLFAQVRVGSDGERGRAAAGHVVQLAREPRPVGSPAHDVARDYIVATLAAAGIDTEIQRTTVAGNSYFTGRVENIIATIDVPKPQGVVLLIAHYDSVLGSPGAGDDAVGVGVLIEALRAVKMRPPARARVVGLFTDGEEAGLLGIQAFVRDLLPHLAVTAAINMESRGSAGPALLFEVGPGSAAIIRAVADTLRDPRVSSIYPLLYGLLPYDTDFTPVREAGIGGLNFANISQAGGYHLATDTAAALSLSTVSHYVETVVSATQALAAGIGIASAGSGGEADEMVFFDLLGLWFVHYSARTQQVLATLLFVATVLMAGRALISRRGFGDLAFDLAVWVGAIVVAGLALPALLGVIFDAAEPSYSLVTAAASITVMALLSQLRRSAEDVMPAAAVLWAGLTLVLSVQLPEAAYLPLWALAGVLLAAALSRAVPLGERWRALVSVALGAGVVAIVAGPVVYWLAIADARLGMMAAALVAASASLLSPPLRRDSRAAALVFGLTVLTVPILPREPKTPVSHVSYGYDAATGQGRWMTNQQSLPPWDSALFANRGDLPGTFARSWISRQGYYAATAPPWPVSAPGLHVVSDSRQGDQHHIRLRLRPESRGALFYLYSTQPLAATIDGVALSSAQIRRGLNRQNQWGLRFAGAPVDGIDVALVFPADARPMVQVFEQRPGIPAELFGRAGRAAAIPMANGIIDGSIVAGIERIF